MSDPSMYAALLEVLQKAPRGTCSRLCEDTCVSKPEISNALAGRRPLPAEKTLICFDWLLTQQIITLEARI